MTNTPSRETPPPQQPAADEAVQLTELRPVEQSRIKETTAGDDTCVTDGLKALRSFSRRQLDEFQQFGSQYPRKRKAERWKHLSGAEFAGLDSEDDECVKRINGIRRKRSGVKLIDPLHDMINDNDEEDEEDEEEVDEDEDLYHGINGDFDYLDERNVEEVYVYRQRDPCSSPELEKLAAAGGAQPVAERVAARKDEEEEEAEEGEEENQEPAKAPAKRPRGRPRKKKLARPRRKEKEPASSETEKFADSPEKELQSKINDIIKANYLLEQENNNIVESSDNNNELDKRSVVQASSKDSSEESSEDQQRRQPDPPKKYSCELCEARFKGSGGLRNHYKVVHSKGPLFKCDECGKEFPLKERLKLHVRTHTGFKPYKCDECDKSFARGGQLVQHRRTHSQIKPYSCELCSGTFTCAANLALHVKRHNGQKDHKCDICGRGFVRRDALKKHLECLHRDVKSFLCSICNKTFKGHLPQHMRTHAQDRPHGCATCGQRFAQKSQLTVHQRTHSGQRPFRCLVCWQAFAHSTALKLHTRRHTGERPFKCAECSAGFTQLPHWKKHMKCIHGRSEPYCCRNCNSFFRIKNDLEAHEKGCLAKDQDEDSGDVSASAMAKFRNMSIEKMRLLLAVLLKRISKQERLDELGFGKRLIDEVLVDSLESAGKEAVKANGLNTEFEALRKNLSVFLEWTVPKEHWDNFRKLKKTPEEVLETLTAT
ncbi:zinc finger protein 260-like [Phymastichus coffea]|uniref:zinc finger protein 260-like n=1 Tax=Phymastichus coffea TaxID=108790 RepID=UPI00273BC7AC|nr:zinc finger protein 260-like [Phymastichus coffea]XP_058803867.1 zinc finger protein 260-like [Phymastichus coffea]